MPKIAIVWDFDGTLSPEDSTTKAVEILNGDKPGSEFWDYIESLRGDKKKPEWEHVLASNAPIWMYALSRLAFNKKVPLNTEFFRTFVAPEIKLFANVPTFLRKLKDLQDGAAFCAVDLEIHHFVVSAGLKDLVELVFPENLITWTFGCRYTVVAYEGHEDEPESIPVFCMDETVKTRSLFEISKGSFDDESKPVNTRVEQRDRWVPFTDIIYVGDGPTDIPALSLVRDKGGTGIVVYDPNKKPGEVNKRLKQMRLDGRADLITPADFKLSGELFRYISSRCEQVRQRHLSAKPIGL